MGVNMEQKIKKVFEMTDKGLKVTVTADDKIFLPKEDGGKEFIGHFEQTTIQYIDKEKAILLRDFIKKEYDKGQKQFDAMTKQLEPLKDVKDIDDKLLKELQDRIGKGSKVFKQKMLILNDHIQQVTQKKQLTQQVEFVKSELEKLTKELKDINKVI